MSGGFTWTNEEIDQLHADRAAGLSFAECAANQPRRSVDAIRSRLKYERSQAKGGWNEMSEARELGAGRFRDREYVDLCLRHGGFVALQFKPRPVLRIAA